MPNSLEHWAADRPDDIAIVDGDTTLTFRAWNDAADRAARGLLDLGAQPGDIIAIRSQIRHEWQIVHAAAAKLGCSVLPFNWRLTTVETRFVLEDSRATFLVFDDDDPAVCLAASEGLPLKARISLGAGQAPDVVRFANLIDTPAPTHLFSTGRPPLIIYTSGTTGRPKGVAMIRAEVTPEMLEYVQSIEAVDPQRAGAVTLLTLPMHHGAGPNLCWNALRAGNPIVMMRRFEPEAALAVIERWRVNHWTVVPTMLKRVASLAPDVLARYDISSIRSIRVGAAPVPSTVREWTIGHFGHVLHEGYGATEVGMIAHLRPEDMQRKPGSSGLPHRHVHIRIKDESGHALPAGQVGAVWVKSPVVIDRYLNGPMLGRDVLDSDSYFAVGDAGWLDEDGFIYLSDRIKDMIISGGVNIYPAEIEAAMITHPAVQDVAVIGIPDDEFGEAVKAFVELRPGMSLDADTLQAFIQPLLASYKRPRTIEFVAELPRSTMGKVLKRELRNPFWKNQERSV
ncbi:class I adenylate-forming enzyme family protein [Burkholderia lata]|uniref:class I adenylate-forming enzyme family protein n=1 Tax=Burkholderia lata (strain ATCC 17760 / DSM 23089 / LMG 22485 / NCIMB 9086 / R18194 / 383) TaxID=482957 RepID=UPI00003A779B|nr:AMP-binding protein [Burkholderia lata]